VCKGAEKNSRRGDGKSPFAGESIRGGGVVGPCEPDEAGGGETGGNE